MIFMALCDFFANKYRRAMKKGKRNTCLFKVQKTKILNIE